MIKDFATKPLTNGKAEIDLAPMMQKIVVKGIYLYRTDGRVFLDYTSGIAVTNLVHCHPEIIDTICNQSNELMHASNLFYNKIQPQLAEQLVECTGLENAKCFFCNSGAEANEGMIKLARLWGSSSNKYEIITMKQSFHGRTLATLTLSLIHI